LRKRIIDEDDEKEYKEYKDYKESLFSLSSLSSFSYLLHFAPVKRETIQLLSLGLLIGLVLWGGYSLLYYLGVPVHISVLFPDWSSWLTFCAGDNAYFCRGALGFWPFLAATIGRFGPLAWYVVGSLVLYALYLGYHWLNHEQLPAQLTWRLWHPVLFFMVSLWLLFTTLAYGTAEGQPIRRIYEPGPEVYQNISPETLESLEQNFTELQDANCLQSIGETENGIGIFDLKGRCIQQAFFTRVLSQVGMIALLLLEMLVLGSALLRLLRVPVRGIGLETVFSLAIGACALIALLWLAAVAGVYTSVLGWAVLVIVPILCYKSVLTWLERLRSTSIDMDVGWGHVYMLLCWLLISYLAFNFLSVVRPFPIGWDDLGSYVNRPHLLVSYGRFIPNMTTFQWEYLTSVGFLLFGYDSVFGATLSMLINWAAGILAILGVLVFGSTYLGRGRGILAAILYYVLPLVGHFSFADMKVDNAVFAMGAIGTMAVFLYLFPRSETKEGAEEQAGFGDWRWLIVAGVLLGFDFAMKPTAIMTILALIAVIAGVMLHWSATVGIIFGSIGLFIYRGVLSSAIIRDRLLNGADFNPTIAVVIFVVLALACIGFAFYKRRLMALPTPRSVGIFVASVAIAMLPWLVHNNIKHGNIVPRLELGVPNTFAPVFDMTGTVTANPEGGPFRSLSKELAIDPNHPECKGTSRTEELDRYWGFRTGWGHFLTLPWRSVMNLDSVGYYVTLIPALLLFPLLLLLPFFWTQRGRWLRWLFAYTLFLVGQWVFLANGVPWYGVGMFFGLVIGIEVLIARAPDLINKTVATILITLSILIALGNRMWQFEQQRNLLEYPIGKISAETLRERTIPHYDNIRDLVVERASSMPDRPYLFRIGTFIPYFIPKNLEIIGVGDQQLQMFNCLYQERDAALALKRLQALGFNSIIFDTNTATIEENPEGTLHKKVDAFVNFVNTPGLGLNVVVNDPGAGVAYILLP
jgi:hypothetical protein